MCGMRYSFAVLKSMPDCAWCDAAELLEERNTQDLEFRAKFVSLVGDSSNRIPIQWSLRLALHNAARPCGREFSWNGWTEHHEAILAAVSNDLAICDLDEFEVILETAKILVQL